MILAWKLQTIVSLYTWFAEINGVYAGSLTTKISVGHDKPTLANRI